LNVFFGRSSLGDMLARHGKVVTEYGAVLREVSDVDPGMKDRLSKQEEDARVLARLMPQDPLSHTSSLLIELATNYEWDRLRDLAERALASDDGAVKVVATRMLALSMAHDETAPDRSSAIKLYESLVSESTADAADFVNLGSLLMDQKQLDAAKSVVLRGLTEVPAPLIAPLTELGHRLIEQSGDRAFRQRMEEVIARKPM